MMNSPYWWDVLGGFSEEQYGLGALVQVEIIQGQVAFGLVVVDGQFELVVCCSDDFDFGLYSILDAVYFQNDPSGSVRRRGFLQA